MPFDAVSYALAKRALREPVPYHKMIKCVFWGDASPPVGIDDLLFMPIQIPAKVTVTALGFINVDVGNFKIGIYEDNGYTPEGGSLLAGSGSVAAVADQKNEWTLPSPLELLPGLYWIAFMSDATRYVVGDGSWRTSLGGTLHGHYIDVYGFANPLPDPCPAVIHGSIRFNSYIIVS